MSRARPSHAGDTGWDRRDLTPPFDVVGDVHGCLGELVMLLERLGWRLGRDEVGRPVGAAHPDRRTAVFVGDLVDRGPDTPGVLRLVLGMLTSGDALCVRGNHEAKLQRALGGARVSTSHGLDRSLSQLGKESVDFRRAALDHLDRLPDHLVLDEGRLVVAHAGLEEALHGSTTGRVRAFALYGDTTGQLDEHGFPVRLDWSQRYRGAATVLYGHTPVSTTRWVNGTLCLDTGAVFGGHLSALRLPEGELIAVPAEQTWWPARAPLLPR